MLYMLDTNIISYFAEGSQNVILNLQRCLLSGNEIGISVIAYYEVERGLKYIGASKKLAEFYSFASQCELIPVTIDAAQKASDIYAYLRKSGRIIEDADILIGASALSNNAVLVTNNEEHLGRIGGLQIENWTE